VTPSGHRRVVAGCRRDNNEHFLICVDDNVVTTELLRAADPKYSDYPPLSAKPKPASGSATVIEIPLRRSSRS
jgi:hypothetical protein